MSIAMPAIRCILFLSFLSGIALPQIHLILPSGLFILYSIPFFPLDCTSWGVLKIVSITCFRSSGWIDSIHDLGLSNRLSLLHPHTFWYAGLMYSSWLILGSIIQNTS